MSETEKMILGLDIGSNSIGWVLLKTDGITPTGIIDMGSRIFEAGVNLDEKDSQKASKNTKRREARGRRRLLQRRRMRLDQTQKLLIDAGLLPPEGIDSEHELAQTNPYELRAKALNEKLDAYDLGRAIYQLAHRRGFQTNRKSTPKDEEEDGTVAASTSETEREMREKGARTYGEYLSEQNPHKKRLRGRYTQRMWFKDEFNEIWDKQMEYHPSLTQELMENIERSIFWQRPLKSASHLIGECEMEPGRKRAPMAVLSAQRMRLLQDVNNLRLNMDGIERELTPDERKIVVELLESSPKATFVQMRKALKESKLSKTAKFNFEIGGRKELPGNRTAARLREVFGDKWEQLTNEQRDQIVEDVLTFENEEALARRAEKTWGLDSVMARKLAIMKLEEGYSAYSRKAIAQLLPHLEAGLSLTEAVRNVYGYLAEEQETCDSLPPLREVITVRNPIVERSLSECRHLVNTLIDRHGKPDKIRIELARDLKKTSTQRIEIMNKIAANERARKKAMERLEKEGIPSPSRDLVTKVLLADECGWVCPYTNQGFNMAELISASSQIDIEHIIPFSRSLDNSFMNKTLCFAEENRNVKRNRTPMEAYEGDEEKYRTILERVKKFPKETREAKLRRFTKQEVKGEDSFVEEFSSQQLNDTRYASRLARDYLSLLYGKDWRLHLQVNSGGVTAYLRGAWELNNILGKDGIKTRSDHRHHAVDALVVALTDAKWVKRLSTASRNGRRPGKFDDMEAPWHGFHDEVKRKVDRIVVSHKVDRRVNGPLHKETFYGLIRENRETSEVRAVLRKPVTSLSAPEIAKGLIVDKTVRAAVAAKLAELGEPDPLKAFADPKNHPCLITKNGRSIPIHRVRVFQSEKPVEIGGGANSRHVALKNNHHAAFYKTTDKKGEFLLSGVIVTRMEAMRRRKLKLPIVARADPAGNELAFSLAIGDAVEFEWKGERRLFVVQKLSVKDYNFRLHSDARMEKDRKQDPIRFKSDTSFTNAKPQKKTILIDGRVVPAND